VGKIRIERALDLLFVGRGSGSFGVARDEAASGPAAIKVLDGAAGLSAGGVTFAVREVAGSSGRTGSVESFGFAGGGPEVSAAFAGELAAEVVAGSGICFSPELLQAW